MTLAVSTFGQKMIAGKYCDYFDSHLSLNTDSTWDYSYHFDLTSSWSYGRWKINNDTVFLINTPIYDTVRYFDSINKTIDTLVLSIDKKSEQIILDTAIGYDMQSGGQNRVPVPKRLYYKNDRLYEISDNGQLKEKKVYCPFRQKKFEPYYEKQKLRNGDYKVYFNSKNYDNYKIRISNDSYKKYTKQDTIKGKIIRISDYILVFRDDVNDSKIEKSDLAQLIDKSFGEQCIEIIDFGFSRIKFRSTYIGNLHITINEGELIKENK